MKRIEKKSFLTKRRIALIVPAILLLVGGGIALAYTTKNWPFNEPATYDKSSDNTVDTKEEGNGTTSGVTTQNPTTPSSEDKTAQAGNPVNQAAAPEIPKIIMSEGIQSGDSIRVSATLNNASNGKCILRLEKTGYSSIVKEAPVVVAPSNYACDGFRVPRSELPVGGQWSAIVTHELSGKNSTSERKAFNVQ